MKEISLKEFEEIKREIALEIMEIFKDKNLSVALMDQVIEHTRKCIYRNASL